MLRKNLALGGFLGALEEVELARRGPLHGSSLGGGGGRRLQQAADRRNGQRETEEKYRYWLMGQVKFPGMSTSVHKIG